MAAAGTTQEADLSLTKTSTKGTIAPKMFNDAKKCMKRRDAHNTKDSLLPQAGQV